MAGVERERAPASRVTAALRFAHRVAKFLRLCRSFPHEIEQIHRQREDDRRTLFAGNVCESSEVSQLHRLRMPGQLLSCFDKPLRSLLFTLRIDDLCAPQAFRLRLLGNCTDHLSIKIDMLQFHVRDLDAPGIGLRVEDSLHVRVGWPTTDRSVVCANSLVA